MASTVELQRELSGFLSATSSGSRSILYLIDFSIEARRAIIGNGTTAFFEIFNRVNISADYMEQLSSSIVERLIPVTSSLLTFDNSVIHLVLDGNSPASKSQTNSRRTKVAHKNLYSNVNKLLSSKES